MDFDGINMYIVVFGLSVVQKSLTLAFTFET